MTKQELLKHIGSVEQIGGIKDYTLNDGKGKGVRVIEINTGVVRFSIVCDRCLDIADAFYKENAVSWISKTGIVSPFMYEKDGKTVYDFGKEMFAFVQADGIETDKEKLTIFYGESEIEKLL